jgi:hypothetical protein
MSLQLTSKHLAKTLAALLALAPLWASAATFDLTVTTPRNGGDSAGNSITFADGTLQMSVYAWADLDNGFLEASSVTQFARGLGACNPDEGAACEGRGRLRQLDNEDNGQYDWLLLVFSEDVFLDNFQVQSGGSIDSDVTFWTGNVATTSTPSGDYLDLTNATYSDPDPSISLASLGFDGQQNVDNDVSATLVSIDMGRVRGNAVLIGTMMGEDDDRFMLNNVTADVVPIPAAVWLFFSALVCLGWFRRS